MAGRVPRVPKHRVNKNIAKHKSRTRAGEKTGRATVESNAIESKDSTVKKITGRKSKNEIRKDSVNKKKPVNPDKKKDVKTRIHSGAKKQNREEPKTHSNKRERRSSQPNAHRPPNYRKARNEAHERIMKRQKNLDTPWGRHFQKDRSTRMKLAAGVGGAVGLGMVLTDKQDDDSLSAAGKIAKIGALGIAADYGSQVALTRMGLYNSVTTGDMARVDAKTRGRKVLSVEAEKRWQRRKASQLGVAARIGMVAVGAATLMDIGHRLSEDKKADMERAEQEEQLKMKMQAERQRNHQKSYGYVDMGQIAIQQWEKRIGHYAMGNARF